MGQGVILSLSILFSLFLNMGFLGFIQGLGNGWDYQNMDCGGLEGKREDQKKPVLSVKIIYR